MRELIFVLNKSLFVGELGSNMLNTGKGKWSLVYIDHGKFFFDS